MCTCFREVESGGPGWFGACVQVRCRGRAAEGSAEYKSLIAGIGRRDPGPERPSDLHPLQELTPHVSAAGLTGQGQQNSHGGAGTACVCI